MLNHERFRKLSALGSIGQLSADEYRELDAHLGDCSECRGVQEDYSRIIYHELPKMNPTKWHTRAAFRPISDDSRRDRFVARALAEGIQFSRDVERPRVLQAPLRSAWNRQLTLAFSALVVVLLIGILLGPEHQFEPRSPVLTPVPKNQKVETANFQSPVSVPHLITDQLAEESNVREKVSASDESVRKLQRDLKSAQMRAARLSAEISQLAPRTINITKETKQEDRDMGRDCCTRRSEKGFTWAENRSWQ